MRLSPKTARAFPRMNSDGLSVPSAYAFDAHLDVKGGGPVKIPTEEISPVIRSILMILRNPTDNEIDILCQVISALPSNQETTAVLLSIREEYPDIFPFIVKLHNRLASTNQSVRRSMTSFLNQVDEGILYDAGVNISRVSVDEKTD